jgi:hypothetical protein
MFFIPTTPNFLTSTIIDNDPMHENTDTKRVVLSILYKFFKIRIQPLGHCCFRANKIAKCFLPQHGHVLEKQLQKMLTQGHGYFPTT